MKFDIYSNRLNFEYGVECGGETWMEHLWHSMAVAVDLKTVQFVINQQVITHLDVLEDIVVDNLNYSHIIGRNYQGFLYSFCVYQYARTTFELPPDLPNCGVDQAAS